MSHYSFVPGAAALLILAASGPVGGQPSRSSTMDGLAERYVKLVLAVGQHDADYVDAYYGPKEWRDDDARGKEPLPALASRAAQIAAQLDAVNAPGDEMLGLRLEYLRRQVSAVRARLRMLQGERLTFDEESKALYDAVAPTHPESHYQALVQRLEKRFPGQGALVERFESYRKGFIIPKDRLDRVFRLAIDACRERTARHVRLPEGESFTVEYVTGKSWSGYNWYQGAFRSLIQVNTDLPVYIDRAVDLACHEGYPGHHVYNTLLEKHLVKDRGWIEFTVYPLFSPQSLIAEGTANYGIAVAFPATSEPDSSARSSSRRRASTRPRRRNTTRCKHSPRGSPMPATKRRGTTSLAGSTRRRRRAGWRSTR